MILLQSGGWRGGGGRGQPHPTILDYKNYYPVFIDSANCFFFKGPESTETKNSSKPKKPLRKPGRKFSIVLISLSLDIIQQTIPDNWCLLFCTENVCLIFMIEMIKN